MEDERKTELHQSKEKKKDEHAGKLADTDKKVMRKNVEKPDTSVTKPCVPGEKLVSPSKNGGKIGTIKENAARQMVTTRNTQKTGVLRRHSSKEKTTSKQQIKPIVSNNNGRKLDTGKDMPEESNTDKMKPCMTDTKENVMKDNITKSNEKETPEMNVKLDDTDKTKTGSDVPSVNAADTKEKTEPEQSKITEKDEDSVEENQTLNMVTKKKVPKSGVTISDMINSAVHCFEEEDYMKCIIICEEILNTNWKDPDDQYKFAKAFLYIGKSYEKTDDLENALKFYQFSLAVSKNLSLSQHIDEITFILEEKKKASAEEENKKGNEYFKSKQFKEALACYTEAIKRNPEQAKFYGNRSACYLKIKEYLLSLGDAQNSIRLDPKSVKGYFREGAAYLALNKPSKACTSYSTILQMDPDNEEAKKHYSKSTEKAQLDPNDPEAVKKRIEEEPELIQILNDHRVRSFLKEMERDPTAVKRYMHDISTRRKIQKLLECGLLNASGPNPLLQH